MALRSPLVNVMAAAAKKAKEANRLFRESGKAFNAVHKVATEWGEHKEAVSRRYKENSEDASRSAMRWLASPMRFARPRSANFAMPSGCRRMLSGFTSR